MVLKKIGSEIPQSTITHESSRFIRNVGQTRLKRSPNNLSSSRYGKRLFIVHRRSPGFLIHKRSPQFIIHRRSSLINSQNVPHAFDGELDAGENLPSPALDGDHDLADVSQFQPSMPKKDFRSALNTLRMAFLKLLPVRRNGGAFWHKVLGRPKKLGKGDLLEEGLDKRIRFERLRKDVDDEHWKTRVLNGHPLARTMGNNRMPKKDCEDDDIDDEKCQIGYHHDDFSDVPLVKRMEMGASGFNGDTFSSKFASK